jgi:DNA-directed RNA polymerase specialized sigma24 family protein
MQTYGLGKGTVLGILEEHGVEMRGQGIADDRQQDAIDLYASGLSLKRVAACMDCSAETVRQALMAARVSLRPR